MWRLNPAGEVTLQNFKDDHFIYTSIISRSLSYITNDTMIRTQTMMIKKKKVKRVIMRKKEGGGNDPERNSKNNQTVMEGKAQNKRTHGLSEDTTTLYHSLHTNESYYILLLYFRSQVYLTILIKEINNSLKTCLFMKHFNRIFFCHSRYS